MIRTIASIVIRVIINNILSNRFQVFAYDNSTVIMALGVNFKPFVVNDKDIRLIGVIHLKGSGSVMTGSGSVVTGSC